MDGIVAAEYPVVFSCAGEDLVGIVHRGRPDVRRGVVIVVAGGPQYRAGAHRQFVSLARKLAARGHGVLRFDLRGMGDSSGRHLGFEYSQSDIRAAIDSLVRMEPQIEEVVLLGECESASGILFYAYQDERVLGIALINPWVRTEEGRAQTMIKHYYLSRLSSPAFWRKIRGGDFKLRDSLMSFMDTLHTYLRGRKLMAQSASDTNGWSLSNLPLPIRTAEGLRRFQGKVLLIMSGRDYISREFDEVINSSKAWEGLLNSPRILRRNLEEADHTFSRERWKSQASDWVAEWLSHW